MLYEIPKDHMIYQEIKQKVEKTFTAVQISKIERIQNYEIYQKFKQVSNSLLLKRQKTSGINQKSLFYGSSVNPEDIYNNFNESFDYRIDPANFLSFYSSASSAYEKAYTNSFGEKTVVLSDVLVGRSFCVEKGQWDCKNKMAPKDGEDRYDSVTEKIENEEFVVRIFEYNKAYPEYLITFKKEDE